MKQFLQKTFLLCLFVLMGMTTFAYDFEVNGICYNYGTEHQTVSVVYYHGYYGGDVNIPEKVEYEDVTYCVTSIADYAFSECYHLSSVIIPNSVTSIGYYAFYRCWSLSSVIIPNSVISISNYAFWNCTSLTSVTIGNNVTEIGESAFSGLYNLTEIISLNPTPPVIYKNTFEERLKQNATLYVTTSSKEDYARAIGWRDFLNIQDGISSNVETIAVNSQSQCNYIYTLDGTKLSTTDRSTLPTGIYIIDGKKTVIK